MPRPIAPAPMTPTIVSSTLATLSALEPRLPLLDERANAFRVVVGASRLALQLGLERELRIEVVAHAGVEAALHETERTRRHRREPLGEIEARVGEHGWRNDIV